MKKTYINPEIEVIKTKSLQMLTTSMEISGETTSTFDAREYDFDDFEDEY
jgi:hypothetical protein